MKVKRRGRRVGEGRAESPSQFERPRVHCCNVKEDFRAQDQHEQARRTSTTQVYHKLVPQGRCTMFGGLVKEGGELEE